MPFHQFSRPPLHLPYQQHLSSKLSESRGKNITTKKKKKKRKIIPTLAIVCTASVPLTICHNESLPKGKLFGDADGSQCCEVLFGTNLKITFHQRSKKRPRITFSPNDQLRSQWLLHTQATSCPPTTLLLLASVFHREEINKLNPHGPFYLLMGKILSVPSLLFP